MAFDKGSPGDDTTALVIRARKKQHLDLFEGPPKDPSQDSLAAEQFMRAMVKKISAEALLQTVLPENCTKN
jgi:hypothetical protein